MMKEETHSTHKKRNRLLVVLSLLALCGLAFGGWRLTQTAQAATDTASSPATTTYQTETARRGDLTQTATGSGILEASRTVNLSFAVSGKVAQLNVAVNDHVKAGDVLAALDGQEQLKQDVANQQLALQTAQKELDDLQSDPQGKIAQALKDQSTAQAAYDKAKANVHYKGDNRCGEAKTKQYLLEYLEYKWQASPWQNYLHDPGDTNYGRDYILDNLEPLEKAMNIAYANYVYCAGFTDTEIAASQAALQTATADLRQAQATYQNLKANNGIDPLELQIAQAKVEDAQLALQKAQDALAGATLVSPMDGTVVAINGATGLSQTAEDTTDSSVTAADMTFITLADTDNPVLKVSMDEADMQYFAQGCSAKVTFSSYPDQAYTGTVTEVVPQLVTAWGGSSVQGTVKLDEGATKGKTLLIGLEASVVVTCKSVQNALIVPVKAVYQPAGSGAYVYVLNSQGQPEKREVQIGLRTADADEILSGLDEGERVITTNIRLQ